MLTIFLVLNICLQTKIGGQLAVVRTLCEVLLILERLDQKQHSLKTLSYRFCPVFNYSAVKI